MFGRPDSPSAVTLRIPARMRSGRPALAIPYRRRWPLLVIGASAGTATWSGWVGLGTLTGFGLVNPLPGIWDGLTVNTAITLPLGVEAYAVYALSIATDNRPLTPATRRYAWGPAAAALLLGMGGQIAYHLLDAAQSRHAPWSVVALVSCLPVVVLGAASLLWHLAGQIPDGEPAPDDASPSAPAPEEERTDAGAPVAQPGAPDVEPAPDRPEVHPLPPPTEPGPPTHPEEPPASSVAGALDDDHLVAAVAATVPLPSARQIKTTYRVGQNRAARIRAAAVSQLTNPRPENPDDQAATDSENPTEIAEIIQPDHPDHHETTAHHLNLKIIHGAPQQETQQISQGHDTHATALP